MFTALVLSCVLFSCANRGTGPTGGLKDIDPPVLERSVPQPQAINVTGRHIDLYFDEIVQLTNPTEKVVISPAQIEPATIKALGKRVSIVLNDSLKANSTYTIDFGDALADNNEKNVLHNFAFTFSTGASIDTMQIAGTILDARTLDPVPSLLVGIHQNMADSAFTHLPFTRVAKTGDNGRFTVRGIHNGDYRVYALSDKNGNFFFDQPAEGIAAYPQKVHTSFKMDMRNDTVFTDSAKVDTIRQVKYTRFLPDTLVLRYFQEEFIRQRLMKHERTAADKLTLIFGAANRELPALKPLNFKWTKEPLVQHSLKNDTLTYWLRDTLAAKRDTLRMTLAYQKTDSAGRLQATVDTLNFRFYHPKQSITSSKRAPKEPLPKKIEAWKVHSNVSQDMDIDRHIRFRLDAPVAKFDSTKLHLSVKVDTLWKPLRSHLQPDDDIGMTYAYEYKWKPDTQYKIELDSALFTSLKGIASDRYVQEFRVRALEEYSTLIINMQALSDNAVLELLNNSDQVVRVQKAKSSQVIFNYILPGVYYLRMYVDANKNGEWDTGNFSKKQEPEAVYYFPAKITLRANWDIEQDWNPEATPLDKQKPKELIKKESKTFGR